ncbi:MAG: hypothetical protein U9Q62_11175 [Campylobacterota bacterium]|nr:hypothetical protein [Campylobacterota bacterium]
MGIVMEKVDIVVKLKEKIAEARDRNDVLATQLQKLLDGILRDSKPSAAI